MALSKNQEELILKNRKLVHYLVQKLGIEPNDRDYEDIISIGTLGLIKAAKTYDSSKEIKFSTYASRCINNEIFMYYRKINKYINDVYLEDSISNDDEGHDLSFLQTIEDPNSNFIEVIENLEAFIKIMNIILNCLKKRERLIMLYQIAGIKQENIAKQLKISRSYVARIEKRIIEKVKQNAELSIYYEEVFSMSIVETMYQITFSSKSVQNFNKIFATFLRKVTDVSTLPDFKINCNKERIIIQIPAELESFAFIAEMIEEIDEFNMSFTSSKKIFAKENNVQETLTPKCDVTESDEDVFEQSDNEQTKESTGEEGTKLVPESLSISLVEGENMSSLGNDDDIVEQSDNAEVQESADKKEIQIISDNLSTSSIEVDKTTLPKKDSTAKRGVHLNQVREYLLSRTTFTVDELRKKFPDIDPKTINNAINLAKSKGLITKVERGKYAVKKD